MVVRKLDDDAAFDFYVALGMKRSFGAVAREFGVGKRAISKASRRGKWIERLEKIEADARVKSDQKLTETLAEVRDRHLKILRAVASRGVQALQASPLEDAMQGVKAIEMAIKLERTILGEPSDRFGVSVEEMTRREVETFLTTIDDDDEDY